MFIVQKTFAILALCQAISPSASFVPLKTLAPNKLASSSVNSRKYAFYSSSATDAARPFSADNNNNNNNGEARYSNLSVTELKKLLIERGIDFRDCVEKRDLVERLRASEAGGPYGRNYQQQSPHQAQDGLMSEELTLIDTFKRVSPSVANIKTTTVVPAQNGLQLRPMEVPMGTGSGFLWDDRGHVVTNFHVVTMGRQDGRVPELVKVKLAGLAEARDAQVVGVEPEKDLAVLRLLDRRNLPAPIPIGASNDLQVGQSVLAIGNPFGLDDTLTKGIVSALGRDVDGIGGRPIHGCIQTDAAINQGNSGGPLMDSRGRLIGVNTAIFSPSGGNVGIGFAIPVDTVRRVVNQIIQYGRVVRPTLGMSIVDDRLVKAIEMQLGRPFEGCLVANVVGNSPASNAGLQASQLSGDGSIILGDLVTEINGEKVRQAEDLISAVEEKSEGDVVTLRVLRKCDPRRVEYLQVKLTTRDKLDSDQRRNMNNLRMPWQ